MKSPTLAFIAGLAALCLQVHAETTQPASSQPKRLIPTGRPAGSLPPEELANPYVPCQVPAGVKTIKNLEYTKVAGKPLLLDLYIPESHSGPLPLVVWIHGGSWRAGTKGSCPALWLTENGYAVASIDYRLTGVATWPAQIYDCKAAVRWLRAHAEEYRLDPDHIGAWGNSAGAHLAAMLGVTGDVKELEGDEGNLEHSSRVQAVCDWYAPSDLIALSELFDTEQVRPLVKKAVRELLGGSVQARSERARQASPVTWTTDDDSPFLIIHGDSDRFIPASQSAVLYEALRDAGVESSLHVVRGAGHARAGFVRPEVQKMVLDFFDKNLKPEAKSARMNDLDRPAAKHHREFSRPRSSGLGASDLGS